MGYSVSAPFNKHVLKFLEKVICLLETLLHYICHDSEKGQISDQTRLLAIDIFNLMVKSPEFIISDYDQVPIRSKYKGRKSHGAFYYGVNIMDDNCTLNPLMVQKYVAKIGNCPIPLDQLTVCGEFYVDSDLTNQNSIYSESIRQLKHHLEGIMFSVKYLTGVTNCHG